MVCPLVLFSAAVRAGRSWRNIAASAGDAAAMVNSPSLTLHALHRALAPVCANALSMAAFMRAPRFARSRYSAKAEPCKMSPSFFIDEEGRVLLSCA